MQKSGRLKVVLLYLLMLSLAWACDRPLIFEEGYVLSQTDSIYYKTIGQGEPILIIHGGPVLDHQYLFDHFKPLSKSYKLIFYDQRACGRSQLNIPLSRMTFDAMLNDIQVIKEQLGYDKIHVLGHSWGGLVAMKYAIEYKESIDKLILSNSMAPSTEEWNRENAVIASRYTSEDQNQLDKLSSSGLLRTKEAAPYIEQMMMLSFKPQFYDQSKMELLSLKITNDYLLRSSTFMNLASEISTYDLYNDLADVSAPTLIIYGEQEPAKDLYLSKFVKIFPNASIEVIDRSGHFPFIEQPDYYFQKISDFIKR